MTEVAFHFNLPGNKLAYACRLLRKASGAGSGVGVVADVPTLAQLDQALWSFSALDFIAHCGASAPESLRRHSPIVLAESCQALPDRPVLLNLGQSVPEGFERFERLIELVSTEQADRDHARERWHYYADRGYPILRHDLTAKE